MEFAWAVIIGENYSEELLDEYLVDFVLENKLHFT